MADEAAISKMKFNKKLCLFDEIQYRLVCVKYMIIYCLRVASIPYPNLFIKSTSHQLFFFSLALFPPSFFSLHAPSFSLYLLITALYLLITANTIPINTKYVGIIDSNTYTTFFWMLNNSRFCTFAWIIMLRMFRDKIDSVWI